MLGGKYTQKEAVFRISSAEQRGSRQCFWIRTLGNGETLQSHVHLSG